MYVYTHLVVNIQGIICAVAELSSELLEVCEYICNHLTEASTLDPTKLYLL